MSTEEELPARDRWARLRFAIIGPLLAAPPADGELQAALEALAAKTWRHPFTALELRFGTSTIQRWHYAARRAADPVAVLRNQVRGISAASRASLSKRCKRSPSSMHSIRVGTRNCITTTYV